MGAVAVTEQAIINEAHEQRITSSKQTKRDEENTADPGAYVAFPKKGVHKWIGQWT